jgi:hypothetical protein
MEDIIESIKQFLEIAFYITIGAAVRVMHFARKGAIDKKRVIITFTFAVFVGCNCQPFINPKRPRKI